MRAEVHRGPWEDLLADWTRLHAGLPRATPFSSAGWARAWWPHFGAGADSWLVVARDHGRVAGLAALARRRKGPLRVLEPVGVEPGDRWELLAEPGRGSEVAHAVAAALARHRRDWDAWSLRCLSAGAEPAAGAVAAGLRVHGLPAVPSPALALPVSFDAYLATLGSGHRRNLRRHLRRLDEDEVRLRPVTDPVALGPAVERWQALRLRQWAATGRTLDPLHRTPAFPAFVRDVLRELVPVGQGLLWEFVRDGEVVGSYVNFADPSAFHWYLGGFDPDHASLGLGKIAVGHGIRTSIEAGRGRFDFGRGAEGYKYWFGARDEPLDFAVAGTGRPRSRAATAALAARSRRRAASEPPGS